MASTRTRPWSAANRAKPGSSSSPAVVDWIRAVGVETGGSNVQFALDPTNGDTPDMTPFPVGAERGLD